MSHQVIYQPESQGEKRTNVYSLTTEQSRLINNMMPVGYCLVGKSKTTAIQPRLKQNAPSQISNHRGRPKTAIFEGDEPIKQAPVAIPIKPLSLDMQRCLRILTKLRKNYCAGPFDNPVDPREVPEYYSIIKNPMDLSTVENNIVSNQYTSIQQFINDVKRIWDNAYTFNAPQTPVYELATTMENFFHRVLREEGLPVPASSVSNSHNLAQSDRLVIEKPVIHRAEPPKKKQAPSNTLSETPMTMQEKRLLGQRIKKLPHEHLRGVWQIVNDNQENREQLEFDIETLPVKKVRHLQSFVNGIINNIEVKMKDTVGVRSYVIQQQDQELSENESSFIIDSDGSD